MVDEPSPADARIVVATSVLSAEACARLVAALDALPLHFEPGRQGTGYDKASLLTVTDAEVVDAVTRLRNLLGSPPAFDAWWLVYPPGSHIPAHVDPSPADGLAHLRVNLMVERGAGGTFVADCRAIDLAVGDAVLFRPDVVGHAVGLVKERSRRVLSVGTVLPEEAAALAMASGALRR